MPKRPRASRSHCGCCSVLFVCPSERDDGQCRLFVVLTGAGAFASWTHCAITRSPDEGDAERKHLLDTTVNHAHMQTMRCLPLHLLAVPLVDINILRERAGVRKPSVHPQGMLTGWCGATQ